MNFVVSIATPSGEKVLAKSNGRQVRFTAFAFEKGYAAKMLRDAVVSACAFLHAETAAVSCTTICGIVVAKI